MDNRHKRLLLLLPLLLCAVSTSAQAAGVKPRKTCQSLACVNIAADIASKMNQSADPCDDFYSYACGNFPNLVSYNPRRVESDEKVGDLLYVDSMSLMTDKIEMKLYEMLLLDKLTVESDSDIRDLYNVTRLFFQSCTEWLRYSESSHQSAQLNLSVSFMKGILDHLMQSIDPNSVGEKMQLEGLLAAMVRAGGGGLIAVSLPYGFAYKAFHRNSDLTNVTRARVQVPDRNWFPAETVLMKDSMELRERFVDFLKSNDVVQTLSLDKLNVKFAEISKHMRDSKLRMTELVPPKCSNQTGIAQYTVAKLDALSNCAYPNNAFSWTLFFEELLQSKVDPDALVEVKDAHWLITVMSYFKNQSMYSDDGQKFSGHASYLIFDWLMGFADFLPTELRQKWRKVIKPMYGDETVTLRPKTGRIEGCMLWTKSYMQPIVERMYRSVYHPKAFEDVKDLIHLIKNASVDSVCQQSWIKSVGQAAIIDKINWVQHSIGLDELTTRQLKAFYNVTLATFRAMEFSTQGLEHNFGSLMSVVLCANARKNFDLMGGNSPVTVFLDANPLDVNAYNYVENNRIVFPMAILEPPVYHPSYPDYIKLGNLGTIIGHEIGHSFDNYGHELNRLGAVGHFWDNETEAAYLERVECVRSCYGNYTLFPGGPHFNSNTTLGNDISDIIGIKAAYGALQMLKRSRGDYMPNLPNLQVNLNQDQLFFVQAAQGWCMKAEQNSLISTFGGSYPSHTANHLRVKGVMQNSWEFAQTFQCELGKSMHPRNKCSFW